MTQTRSRGVLLVLISALMFGSYGVWSRLIGNSFEVFFQGWTRGLIIAVALLPILLVTKQLTLVKREDWKWLSVFLVAASLTQAPIFYAFNHLDIGTATLLFFVSALITMYIVGFLFLGEKISTTKAISFIVATIGLYLVFSFSLAAFAILAMLMAVLNGVASGSEVSFSKKLSGNYSPLYISWLSWVAIFITNLVVSVVLGETQHLPTFSAAWGYQLGYSITGLIGFWAVIQGLKSVEASIGGLIGLLEIIFSITLGILIFHEGLTPRTVVGALLVITAAALPHIAKLVQPPNPTETSD